MGHLLTSTGVWVDPMKVKAIAEMPRPNNKKAVERLLGTVQYLSRFLPKLSDVAKPLRQLTEKEVVFTWQQQQEHAFTLIKDLVTSSPVLKYYNIKEEVTLQCDASETGIGAALLQAGQPVAYTSRALTNTEQQYTQIEKECMAIVYASEKFNQYILGRDVITVETDHKPLIPIFKKCTQATAENAPASAKVQSTCNLSPREAHLYCRYVESSLFAIYTLQPH